MVVMAQKDTEVLRGRPELIVKVRPQLTGLPDSPDYAPALDLHNVLQQRGARLLPIRPRLGRPAASNGMGEPSQERKPIDSFFAVDAPEEQFPDLVELFRRSEAVETAYVKPPASPAVPPDATIPDLNAHLLPGAGAPAPTKNFVSLQRYLGAAPEGVDALYAWGLPGGRGTNVRIIDVEGAWRFTHEDLSAQSDGVLGGVPSDDVGWRNHGSAVMGVICGADNQFGITGIAPESRLGGCSIFSTPTSSSSSNAILEAADQLGPGDILVVELHRPGPLYKYGSPFGQAGFIPVEWWEDDYLAIREAVDLGIIVVAAAGNGAVDLDHPLYDTPHGDFTKDWRNPFRRAEWDSGAILVGAGAPPRGLGPTDYGPPRSRLAFSNYGAALDAQGWGRDVATTGYGELQGGDEDRWYTAQFAGTSSATPIVAATLACLQGIREAKGQPRCTPAQARALLRSTGTPQADVTGRPVSQRIGALPNLRELVDAMDAWT